MKQVLRPRMTASWTVFTSSSCSNVGAYKLARATRVGAVDPLRPHTGVCNSDAI